MEYFRAYTDLGKQDVTSMGENTYTGCCHDQCLACSGSAQLWTCSHTYQLCINEIAVFNLGVMLMLFVSLQITLTMSWKKAKKLIKEDPRYKAFSDDDTM